MLTDSRLTVVINAGTETLEGAGRATEPRTERRRVDAVRSMNGCTRFGDRVGRPAIAVPRCAALGCVTPTTSSETRRPHPAMYSAAVRDLAWVRRGATAVARAVDRDRSGVRATRLCVCRCGGQTGQEVIDATGWRGRERAVRAKIFFVTLAVDDLQRSVNFYRDGLGWPTEGIVGRQFHDEVTGADRTIAFFTLDDGLMIGLYERGNLAKDASVAGRPAQLDRVQPGYPRRIAGGGQPAARAGRSRWRHAVPHRPTCAGLGFTPAISPIRTVTCSRSPGTPTSSRRSGPGSEWCGLPRETRPGWNERRERRCQAVP